MGLDVEHVDLDAGVIRVERAWDAKTRQFVDTKSRAGRRAVSIPDVLREHLREHLLLHLGRSHGLLFGRTATEPFDASTLAARAEKAWTAWQDQDDPDARLEPITLHECRHTFASLMIAAGVNTKALASYMGHASVIITLDRYGHLMPGNEEEAARLLDDFLQRVAAETARTA